MEGKYFMNNINHKLGYILYSMFILQLLTLTVSINTLDAQAYGLVTGREKYFDANFEGAIRDFKSALTDPNLIEQQIVLAKQFLGACYIKLDNETKGAEYFRDILEKNPNEPLNKDFIGDKIIEKVYDKIKQDIIRLSFCNLTITSEPEGADIYRDGIFLGTTPKTIGDLQKGKSYNIRVTKSGYDSRFLTIKPNKDTTVSVMLNPDYIPISKSIIKPTLDDRSFLIGATTGAILGVGSQLISLHFEHNAENKLHLYNIPGQRDSTRKKIEKDISQSLWWSDFFNYSSYVLAAVGFWAGAKISEPFFQGVGLDNESETELGCSLDKNLSPTLSIRRKIW